MWVFTQGPVTKISMETHKNHLVLSGRCICVSYCCRSLRVFTSLCHLVEKPQVFVMIPQAAKATENKQLCRSTLKQISPESVGLHPLETFLDWSCSGYQWRLYYFKHSSVQRLPVF